MDKEKRPYSVEAYNPKWGDLFNQGKEQIQKIIDDPNARIEHIGSTSVEGLWAKPQIDVLVMVDDLGKIREKINEFEKAGYGYSGDYTDSGEEYFYRDAPSGQRLLSIHIMQKDRPNVESQIYVRDYLRSHPDVRDEYSKVKKEAWGEGKYNRVEYSKRKKEFIQDLIRRAHEWVGK